MKALEVEHKTIVLRKTVYQGVAFERRHKAKRSAEFTPYIAVQLTYLSPLPLVTPLVTPPAVRLSAEQPDTKRGQKMCCIKSCCATSTFSCHKKK